VQESALHYESAKRQTPIREMKLIHFRWFKPRRLDGFQRIDKLEKAFCPFNRRLSLASANDGGYGENGITGPLARKVRIKVPNSVEQKKGAGMSVYCRGRRIPLAIIAIAAFILSSAPVVRAQTKKSGFNEREIEPQVHAYDKPDNWTLTFRFKDPRIISCAVPGRNKKVIVWYMLYQVINNTGEPRFFVPDIELKTHDYETVHPDESFLMPAVKKAIAEIEDPTGKLEYKDSFSISKEPIPVSKKDAYPRAVNGIAIWTDVYDRAPKTNRFSIFIAGLSDAWQKDPKTEIIRRKTLQINFQRLGDDIQNDPNAIRWVDNPKWIYRAADVKSVDPIVQPAKNGSIVEPIKEKDKEQAKEKALQPTPAPTAPQDALLNLPLKP
jgi:hypothetical protein